MVTFHANTPIWGTFAGIMHTEHYKVPCTLHFKDTTGIIEVDLPVFKTDLMVPVNNLWVAFGLLNDTPISLTQLPGAPWCLEDCGVIVGTWQGRIIVAFAI